MKLSVITVNYNNFEGLKKTAESILSQTCRDFEWIIIDGSSTDGCREYIVNLNESLTKNGWNPISYWCSEPDKGIYNAMNKGIFHAKGEFVNFMNSGDGFCASDTLECVCAFVNNREADVYYGDCQLECHGICREIRKYHSPLDVYDLYYDKLCHQTLFIKSCILKEKGYDENYRLAADHARNVEMMFEGRKFEYTSLLVARYDCTGISSMANSGTGKEFDRINKDYFPNYISNSLGRLFLYENGHHYKRLRTIIEKRGFSSFCLRLMLKLLS